MVRPVKVLVRIGLALVLLLTAACGAAGSPGGGPVQVLLFGDPEELAAYRAVVDAYHARADAPRVELVEASDRADLIARVSTSIAGGAPPDLFLLNYRYYGQFAAAGALEPLDARLGTGPGQLDTGAFYPQAVDAFRWRGSQVCLPQNVSSLSSTTTRSCSAATASRRRGPGGPGRTCSPPRRP